MNAVAVATRRGRISPDRASAFLGVLAGFSFEIAAAPEVDDLPRLQALAARHKLTAYDAAYLDLAQRLGIPLATLDGDLMSAAIAEGVEIL
jgi:predicted nucleic acid-binding protein